MTTVKLYGAEERSDLPLVLLAPFPVDARVWDEVRGLLGGDVITVDPPGFGGAVADGTPSLDAYADALLAALNAAGVERFVLAGNSMGGYAAMVVAHVAADRLAGIGLLGTKSRADDAAGFANRIKMAEAARSGQPLDEVLAPMREKLTAPASREDRSDAMARLNGWLGDARADSVAWAQVAIAQRLDRTEDLRALRGLPALVMRGSEDPLSSAEDARVMADALGVEVVEVTGRGHLLGIEAPEETAAELRRLWDAARA